jgi:ATP-binding cassette subfamily C protein
MSAERVLPIATGRDTWRWLRRELRARPLDLGTTVLVGLFGAAASVVPVYALGRLVDRVQQGAPSSAIVSVTIAITVSAVLAGVATGLSSYLVGRLGGRILAGLRERTVARALTLPATTLERTGRGELLSRVGADVAAIGGAVSDVLPTLLSSVLLGVLSVAAMVGIDWRLGLAGLASGPLYVLALRWYLPRSAPGYAEERAAAADRSQQLVESMQGLKTIHAYRRHRRHLDGITIASARENHVSISVFGLFTRFVGRINRAEYVGLTAIVVVGFFLVRANAVTVGGTAAAAVLFHRLFNPIGMLLYTFDDMQAAGASLARLVGVVDMPAAPEPPPGARPADTSLVLTGVHATYDGIVEVLAGISLRLAPGERVALVGGTGAGKTTLAAVAAGILAPTRGSALIGGVPLERLASPRSHVAIVSQEIHVFAGTLVDDLRLARPDSTEEEVAAALATVGALGWVQDLPDGLHTIVGEGGHELTAARAQQLALARLVLTDPAVAILDEATAEAGSLGARALEESAAAATAGRTTLVVAHRLTQAVTADRVVVLDAGRIVEEGTHAQLVAAGGRYADLWQAWAVGLPSTA